MKTAKEKRLVAEAAIAEKIGKKIPSEIGINDVSYLMLKEIKLSLEQLIDLQLEKAGKEVATRDEGLPTAQYQKGRRTWLWPKRK